MQLASGTARHASGGGFWRLGWLADYGRFAMTDTRADVQAIATDDRYQALLATSQAIISHRGLSPLFHDLAGQLSRVVHFDFLALVLHEPATNSMRLHVLETCEPVPLGAVIVLPVEDDPAGSVWQTQQPLITSHIDELNRWPRLLERVQQYGVESYCWLPLTTARRRLGTLVFTSKQSCAYDAANLPFLRQVANQVAVAVENALVFQELEALNAKLSKEKAYWKRRCALSMSLVTSSAKAYRFVTCSNELKQLP